MTELLLGLAVCALLLSVWRGGRERATPATCFRPADAPSTVERTFVFADLDGFTALAERRGDLNAARLAERFAWMAVQALQGTTELVKTMGDGLMLCSERNEDALATAHALLGLAEAEPGFPSVAVGVHRGSAVTIGRDYIGASVNVAARVSERARPGQILLTEAAASPRFPAVPEGHAELRSVSEPVFLLRAVREPVRTG